MKVTNMLEIVDSKLSFFLGMNKKNDKIRPTQVKFHNNKILVFSKEPYKRQRIINKWNNFNKSDFHELNENTKKKLGAAIGIAIADDLIVSFDEAKIILIK